MAVPAAHTADPAVAALRPLVVTVAAVLLLVAVLGVVGGALLERSLLRAEQARVDAAAALIRARLEPALAAFSTTDFKPLLQRLGLEAGAERIVVVTLDQQVLAAYGQHPRDAVPERHDSLAQALKRGQRYVAAVALQVGGELRGHALAGFSTAAIRQARADVNLAALGVGGLVLLLGALAGWKSLRRLREGRDVALRALDAMRRGEAPVRLPPQTHPLLEELAAAFNTMAQDSEQRLDTLQRSETRLRHIADGAYSLEAWFNPAGRLVWINRAVERVLGYTPQECLLADKLFDLLVCAEDRSNARAWIARAGAGETGERVELRLRHRDGRPVWVAVGWMPLRNNQGAVIGVRASADDIHKRKEMEQRLLEGLTQLRAAQGERETALARAEDERARLETLLDLVGEAVLFVDRDGRVQHSNRALRLMWGFAESDSLVGEAVEKLVQLTAPAREDDPAFRATVAAVVGEKRRQAQFDLRLRDGRILRASSRLVPAARRSGFVGRLWLFDDVTERQRTEETLLQLAVRDPLTGLYNRRRFDEELERMLAEAARRNRPVGLLIADLDRLKPINDSYGHQAGDQALMRLAAEVSATARRNETLFRIGGDEFAILVRDAGETEMQGLARRVAERVGSLRLTLGGDEFGLSVSVGTALYPRHAANAEDLIAHADRAMYEAKDARRAVEGRAHVTGTLH